MAAFPPLYGTENGIQSQTIFQFEGTVEHKTSFGGWLAQRAFKATLPTLSRQEGKQQSLRKWNSWAGELQAQAEAGATEPGVRRIRQTVESLGSLFQGSGDSEEYHSCQSGINCELSEDGHKQGGYQNICNVEDLISLDQKSHTWTAAYLHAQVTKRRREAESATCACPNVMTDCHEPKGGGTMGGETFGEN